MEQTDASQADRAMPVKVPAAEPTEELRPIGVVIHWDVTGTARHLSHAELMRVFERVCVRAGLPLRFSQGFNPHPRMSLPLPKSVGLESEGDVFCVQLLAPVFDEDPSGLAAWEKQILMQLTKTCPAGIRLRRIETAEPKIKWHPVGVTFDLKLAGIVDQATLSRRIESFLQTETWPIERARQGKRKHLDARSFVKTIQLTPPSVWIEVEIQPTGSLRVNEILQMLELEMEHLAAPIRRTAIQWQPT